MKRERGEMVGRDNLKMIPSVLYQTPMQYEQLLSSLIPHPSSRIAHPLPYPSHPSPA
jgi:hypothetical protein